MGQQEYDAFKQRLREWMSAHPEEYATFESEMNRMDGAGYNRIMFQATTLVSKYKKAVKRKMNTAGFGDVSDLEAMIAEAGIGEKLLAAFEKPDDSTIPAMICWLYFGRSFENMVEMGEELMAGAGVSRFQQFGYAMMIKLLVARSVSLGHRTKQDWKEYNALKNAIDRGQVTDWAAGAVVETTDRKRPGRRKIDLSLPEMFSPLVPDNEELIARIEKYLLTRHTELDLARLKVALEEMKYLQGRIEVRAFREALNNQFGETIRIVGERGIQKSYSRLVNPISATGKPFCAAGEERNAINELKKSLES